MHPIIDQLSVSLEKELRNILTYWSENTLDAVNGGFVGERDFFNKLVPDAPKGIILNSRILWSFAAASNHYQSDEYKEVCERSYNYLKANFKDEEFGGVYWELDAKGKPINTRKQVYAQAFMVYALSEYFQFSKKTEALDWAIELYELIEIHANDKIYKGYIEAFNKDWSPIADMRLSDKDENEAKTMNTHLHVLEAYTNLYKSYKSQRLKNNLSVLIQLFLKKFLNPANYMNLFFDEKWNLKSSLISFGHDIETSWLLIEAAKVIENQKLIDETKRIAILIADKFIENGVDVDGGVLYEYEPKTKTLDSDKHWWPQAEALVGLRYAYDITGDEKYLKVSSKIWSFTQEKIIDKKNGEWFWKVNKQGEVSENEYKVGSWKAPYHNSRACIMLSKSIC